MITSLIRCALVLIAFSVSACASGTPSTSQRQRDIIFDDKVGTVRTDANPGGSAVAVPATPDRTWNAILGAYSMIGVEVKYLNRPAGELGNRSVVISRRIGTGEVSRYLDCGIDPFAGQQANAYPVRVSLVTRMWPDHTGMKIETKFSGSMTKPGAGATVHCSSTGSLESLIGVAVVKLSAAPPS